MDLDHGTIGADCDRCTHQWRNQGALACCVRRIEDHGQVRQLVKHRHRVDVEGVAGSRLEGANAALAEKYIRVAVRDNVLGREQEFLDGRALPALEHDRTAGQRANFFEKREVLHVASADLEHVGIVGYELDVGHGHDFGDHLQPVTVTGLAQQAQTLLLQALETVRAGAGLVGAASQEAASGRGDGFCASHDLPFGFDRARTGDDGELVAADRSIAGLHHGAVALDLLAHELVGRADRHTVLNTLDRSQYLDRVGHVP